MQNPTVLIVTGAHLDAEAFDRPRAYWLRDALQRRLEASGEVEGASVLVCSDLWYLNRDELRGIATVSLGAPGVNALSAYLASRLPSVLAVEGVYVVQMETFEVPLATIWGRDASATGAAAEAFERRHAEEFLDAVATRGGL